MLATDGIYSTVPLSDLQIGIKLGEWEHDPKKQIYSDMFIIQPGLYFFPSQLNATRENKELSNDDAEKQWSENLKTHGIHRSIVYKHQHDFEKAWNEYIYHWKLNSLFEQRSSKQPNRTLRHPVVTVSLTTFTGLQLSISREHSDAAKTNRDTLNTAGIWTDNPREILFDWRNKRDEQPTLIGQSCKLFPYEGSPYDQSQHYDPALLTGIERTRLEFEGISDCPLFLEADKFSDPDEPTPF